MMKCILPELNEVAAAAEPERWPPFVAFVFILIASLALWGVIVGVAWLMMS